MGGNETMHRFLIEPEAIKDKMVTITGDDAKHLLQVLRHQIGDLFFVFDGTGLQYELELIAIDKNKATGKIIRSYDPGTEPSTKVILFQGIPKLDKMEWIIQKSVELGIGQIVPMFTQYAVMKLKDRNIDGRLQRWNRISSEACKQCGRVVIPEVKKPVTLKNALKQWDELSQEGAAGTFMPVFCYEAEGKKCLKDLLICYNIDHVNAIGIFIGPEGGFSAEEIQMAQAYRMQPVSLGKRILRTETAAIAVLSVIMHEMGEWAV